MTVHGVLLDFAGTLFDQEGELDTLEAIGVPTAERADVLAALARADDLVHDPGRLPPELARDWVRRDLTEAEHSSAFVGLFRLAGVPDAVVIPLYDRACSPAAWTPYDDTTAALRALRAAGVPVAVISNIAWDLRPIFARHDLLDLVDAFVLSYEHARMKPDPELFRIACAAIGAGPRDTVMIGDSVAADGGATAIGCRFVHVGSPRDDGALLRALHVIRIDPC